MKPWFNFSNKAIIAAVVTALSAPILWNCIDFGVDDTRFWLLEPNITNQRALLPFTFTGELYYQYGWAEGDTSYIDENVKDWKSMLNDNPSAADIHEILYDVTPASYFGKKYKASNSFIASLNKPAHSAHLQYVNFAKKCESIFNSSEWDGKAGGGDAKTLIAEGTPLLKANAKDEGLSRRLAFQLMKLYRANKQPRESVALYDQYFAKSATKDWLHAAAMYQYAESQTDPLQQNIWLARSWDAGFYKPIWIWHSFTHKQLPASVNAATDNHDKALLTLIPATREPGPALDALQKAYSFDPTNTTLSKLLSREVNKLENWLLSPAIYGEQNRVELPYSDDKPKVDSAALLKSDLAYLHRCREFVQQVINDKKRNDMALWYLAAAHLAYLEQDFLSAGQMAAQGQQVAVVPTNQKVQLQLIALLAELGNSGAISSATEDKIPGIFMAIRQNKDAFEVPEELQANLARLLSDIFMRRHETAKAALLAGKTDAYDSGFGYTLSGTSFDKLLETGKPADFDQAIQIIENPKNNLEKWFAQEPQRYSDESEWDVNTNSQKLPANQPTGWDTDKFREFKAMYYTRRDQLDSALIAIQQVPDKYWKRHGQVADYDHVYFQYNPFHAGIAVKDVLLSQQDTTGKYNKKNFLEKVIELRNTTDPAKQQEAYYLLGNAYYNMTYYGHEWWLMMTPSWSSGEVSYYINGTGSVPEAPEAPWKPVIIWSAIGLLTTSAVGLSRKKGGKWLLSLLLLPVLLQMACNQPAAKTSAAGMPPTNVSFNDIYYRCALAKEWYEKAIKINADNDLGIAATFMAGHCEENQQCYQFTHTRKNWDEEFKPGPNHYYDALKGKNFQSPVDCAYLKDKLK